ncbi:MAG: GntR family transcriptional regulator [Stappiaceae bacterium]
MRSNLRDKVEDSVREALLTGHFIPGKPITLRGLAEELGVSPMPVREALRSLTAARALELLPNGRIRIPEMTTARFEEILAARLMMEPALAEMAFPHTHEKIAAKLEAIDNRIDDSLQDGDVSAYMRFNRSFHFTLYELAPSTVFLPLVETIWLQFAPFMRTVYGRVGTSFLIDMHKEAISAIRRRDLRALKDAINGDIHDGMGILGRSVMAD